MKKAYCQVCKCYPEALIAYPVYCDNEETGEIQTDKIGVILNNDGTCSNQWADGAFGVPDDVRELAEEDETPTCYECHNYVDWRHEP